MRHTGKGLFFVLAVFSLVFLLQSNVRVVYDSVNHDKMTLAEEAPVEGSIEATRTVTEAELSSSEDEIPEPIHMEPIPEEPVVLGKKRPSRRRGPDIHIPPPPMLPQPTTTAPPNVTEDLEFESKGHLHRHKEIRMHHGQTAGLLKQEDTGDEIPEVTSEKEKPDVMKMIEETQPEDDQAVKTGGLRVCSDNDRLKNLREKCEKHPELSVNTGYFPHTKVDEKHKVIICVVPKAAGTSIHNMMHLTMTGDLAPDPNHCGESCWENAGVWPLSHYPEQERSKRLRDYHKIIVVRNPFERLVSCWNDKFKNPGASLHNRQHGFRLIDRIRGVPVNFDIAKELPWSTPVDVLMKKNYSEEIKRELKKEMTFKEFVMLMDNYEKVSPQYHDDHWKPIHQICQPCFVKYDYMVRVETLHNDARHILEKLELDVDKFPHFNSNRESTSQLTKELPIYEQLPENLKQMLDEYYQTDMDLFGYKWDKHEDKASCQSYNSTEGGACC